MGYTETWAKLGPLLGAGPGNTWLSKDRKLFCSFPDFPGMSHFFLGHRLPLDSDQPFSSLPHIVSHTVLWNNPVLFICSWLLTQKGKTGSEKAPSCILLSSFLLIIYSRRRKHTPENYCYIKEWYLYIKSSRKLDIFMLRLLQCKVASANWHIKG